MKVLHDMLLPRFRRSSDTVLGEDPLDSVASASCAKTQSLARRTRIGKAPV